jgi:guanylate kinase
MPGHLIIVAGLSGAGKTTLITRVLNQIPKMRYLTTYTTRPPRDSEQDNFEHIFVSQSTYQKLQQDSADWDHAEYHGAWYGTDVAATKQLLKTHDVICAIIPDPNILRMLKHHYPNLIVIWVNTPSETAKQRISHDEKRSSRQENTALADSADYIFEPTNSLKSDEQAFVRLVAEITSR